MKDQIAFLKRFLMLPGALALCAVIILGAWQMAAAQDGAGGDAGAVSAPLTNTAAVTATGETAAVAAITANDVNDVARQLWCPLCSGVRLDACELKACAQMKDVIGQKLASGEDAGSIKNYFVAQYGPQVLGEPPLEGFNWLAWILPVLALVAGGLFVGSRVRNSTRQAQQARAETVTPAEGDAYSRKLEEELKHYD
jgi:cytochrome c-type biogenesis protein CcmH